MKLPRSAKIYLSFIFTIGSILVVVSLLNINFYTDNVTLAGVVFFTLLGIAAESLPIRVKGEHLIAISSAVSIAAILLFDMHTAVIIRFLAATLAVQKTGTGFSHFFNRPLYKSLFNGFARAITVFFAGYAYQNMSNMVPSVSFLEFNITGLLGLIIVYFLIDSILFSALFASLLIIGFRSELVNQLRTFNQMLLLAPFGVLLAGLYQWQGILPILLFVGPFLFARHILERDIEARQTFQETTVLYQALSKIAGTPDNIRSLTKQIADIVVNDFHAQVCTVWLLSDDHSQVLLKAHNKMESIAQEASISMDQNSLIVHAIKTGETIYVPDVRNDPRYLAGDNDTLSEFVVPLQAHGEIIGVINIESSTLDGFSERTRRFVAAFAQNATMSLQNAKLVDTLEKSIARLRESQARINYFLEHTAEGVYRIDYDPPIPIDLPLEEQYKLSRERGKFGECNLAIAKMYGYSSREEMLAAPYYAENEGYEASLKANIKFYSNGYKSDEFETEEYTPSGEAYFLNNAIGIVRDGYFMSIWGTQRDITPLKKAHSELEKRNAELERYTYTLSHELKTPIVSIRGFLGFLEQDMQKGNTERVRHDLTRIGHAADKMYKMISELIELSRIGRLTNPPEDVPFEEVVLAGLNNAEASYKDHNVQIHIQPAMPTVHVDLTRLIEVVQNLIENSIKYMGDQPNPQITIGVRSGQDEPVFYVSDNGIGVDPEYHERIFNIFEKLDPQADGTGIGLALVKRIIETHGGRIWMESEGIGKGSTICFTLPIKG